MILVIGATGFIGTNLVRELVRQGERVRIFRRASSNMTGLENLPVDEHFGDLLDPESVRRAMRGCTHVYHLAAALSLGPFESKLLSDIHIRGTEIVSRAAIEEGVRRLVYTSSGVTVGYKPGDNPATESEGISMAGLGLPYIDTKIEAEKLILQFCRQGLPAVIVNPGYTFGPWDKTPKLNQFIIMASQGKLNFYFSGGLSVVDVADVVRGHMLALERGRPGERYILSNQDITYRDFFTLLNRCFGEKPPKYKLTYPVLYTAGLFAEIFGRILHFNPQLSTGAARLYTMNHYLSSDKAREELCYRPKPLEESIDATVTWLREHRYIS
jgi:dihydroflavonol-4-reductase